MFCALSFTFYSMRFQVPQFIETEVKVVGPFTLSQFIWVGLGVALLLLVFRLWDGGVRILASLVIILVFGALAFLRINGIPLIEFISLAISYAFGTKKYIFRKKIQSKDEMDMFLERNIEGKQKV